MHCLRSIISKVIKDHYEGWTIGCGWKRLRLPLRKEGSIVAFNYRIFQRENSDFFLLLTNQGGDHTNEAIGKEPVKGRDRRNQGGSCFNRSNS